jgi:hypothetical protein
MAARPWLPLLALYAFWVTLAHAVSGQEPLKAIQTEGYKLGEKIPVSCLNRTMYVLVVFVCEIRVLMETSQ